VAAHGPLTSERLPRYDKETACKGGYHDSALFQHKEQGRRIKYYGALTMAHDSQSPMTMAHDSQSPLTMAHDSQSPFFNLMFF
jgi:hypothetical protein